MFFDKPYRNIFCTGTADQRNATLSAQLAQIAQPDGCYVLSLDIHTCRDGSLLISTPSPFKTRIGLAEWEDGKIAPLVCTAVEAEAKLTKKMSGTAYIVDIEDNQTFNKENKNSSLTRGKTYKLLFAPTGTSPDFAALQAKAKPEEKQLKP